MKLRYDYRKLREDKLNDKSFIQLGIKVLVVDAVFVMVNVCERSNINCSVGINSKY